MFSNFQPITNALTLDLGNWYFRSVPQEVGKTMRGYSLKPTVQEKILLVDDNRMGLDVRRVVLEELGYRVRAVSSALEALEIFCSEAFDMVITDYRMPGLTGIELIARIRACRPQVPIVLLSSLVDPLGLDSANTGADIVIQKNAQEIGMLTRAVMRLLCRNVPRKPARSQRLTRTRTVTSARTR